MLPSSGPKPVRKSDEIFLVDRVENSHQRTLNDLVFQRRDAQRPQFAVSLRYIPTFDGLRSVTATMNFSVLVGVNYLGRRIDSA